MNLISSPASSMLTDLFYGLAELTASPASMDGANPAIGAMLVYALQRGTDIADLNLVRPTSSKV
jgi:hypothetical protein